MQPDVVYPQRYQLQQKHNIPGSSHFISKMKTKNEKDGLLYNQRSKFITRKSTQKEQQI